MLEKAKEMIGKKLFSGLIIMLQSIKFKLYSKDCIMKTVAGVLDSMISSLPETISKLFPKLISAIIGFDCTNIEKSEIYTMQERIHLFLEAFTMIFMPDLVKSLSIIEGYVKFLITILKVGGSKEELIKRKNEIAENIGVAFGANPQEVIGILGVMEGDYQALVDFTAPYCSLNLDTIKSLIMLLADTSSSLSSLEKVASVEDKKTVDEADKSNYIALMRKVNEGAASIHELFQLIDMEGDNSGGISKNEFKSLMT